MSANAGRVLVFGGKGAMGSTIVSHFKERNWWVGSIDMSVNEEANVIVKPNKSWVDQESEVLFGVQEVLNQEKVDALICLAGGWAGGNAAAKEEEEEEEPEPGGIRGQKPTGYPLLCRSIRIGSYRIHPFNNLLHLPVNLSTEAISFRVPTLYDSSKYVLISLRSQDITRVLVHFGRCLPLMFVFTTPSFGKAVRNALRMNSVDECYFDPASRNNKIKKITFLIDSVTDEQHNFIRYCFLGGKKVKEIDEIEANEILVQSTP